MYDGAKTPKTAESAGLPFAYNTKKAVHPASENVFSYPVISLVHLVMFSLI